MLKGEEEFLEENEESSLFEAESSLIKEPLPVVYNGKIPIESFDLIIIDERPPYAGNRSLGILCPKRGCGGYLQLGCIGNPGYSCSFTLSFRRVGTGRLDDVRW